MPARARWIVFAAWAVLILAAAPVANLLQAWVVERLGPGAPRYLLSLLVLGGLAGLALAVRRRGREWARRRLPWILAVAAAVLALAWRLRVAAEPIHLAQYGILGGLAFWALSAGGGDRGIHLAAAVLTALVGTLDEIVQWLLPGRYWDLADVGLNAVAAALVQLLIWKGLGSPGLAAGVGRRSLRLAARLAIGWLLLLLLCLSNTPARIDAYAARVPGLGYLGQGLSTRMSEFGHRYLDPEIGTFRSRLSREELHRADRELGAETAAILDRMGGTKGYHRFQLRYPPHRRPFVFEAGGHLFYRDRLRQRAAAAAADERVRLATLAFREQLILERYFPHTLASSRVDLSAEERRRLESLHRPGAAFESEVSDWLVTAVSESQARWGLLIGLLGLVAAERGCRPRPARR